LQEVGVERAEGGHGDAGHDRPGTGPLDFAIIEPAAHDVERDGERGKDHPIQEVAAQNGEQRYGKEGSSPEPRRELIGGTPAGEQSTDEDRDQRVPGSGHQPEAVGDRRQALDNDFWSGHGRSPSRSGCLR
jgi:hypothetical protein